MKTLIISSSLSPTSHSRILCLETASRLKAAGADVTLVDTRELELVPHHRGPTEDMRTLTEQVQSADNLIFGMGVYCYSINDNLKIILDNCCEHATGKFFGIVCAAGGTKSYLATQHLTQICMNEWRMLQLPRVVYATGTDFVDGHIHTTEITDRLDIFAHEFYDIGNKLLN